MKNKFIHISFRWRTRLIACSILVVMLAGWVSAQTTTSQAPFLSVRGAVLSCDSILLRWAPSGKEFWKQGLVNGYRISRYVHSYTDSVPPNALSTLVVLDSLVVPADTSVWGELMDTLQDANVELAGGAIFGDSLEISLGDTSALMQAYKLDTEWENRYQMNMLAGEYSFMAAHLSGLGFVDTSAEPGTTYIYRVELLGDSVPTMLLSGHVKLSCNDTIFNVHTPHFMVGLGKGGFITLGWKGYEREFISYDIERSEDGVSYTDLSDLPMLNSPVSDKFEDRFMHIDTVSQIGQTYIYRVRGKDAFGRTSAWSDTIHILNRPNPVGIIPRIDSLDVVDNEIIDVYWQYPSEHNSEIEGFEILRSNRDEGPYEVVSGANLLGTNVRTWQDSTPLRGNYYKVKVYDIHGYHAECWSHFAQLLDTIPPGKPATPVGVANTIGQVTVSWTPNPEEDVDGYRVFYSNRDTLFYTQLTLTPVQDTSFQYTIELETLESATWVKIKAVDYNGNLSEFSDPAMISLPDVVPPSPAVITRSGTQANVNRIFWTPSSSTDMDKYRIKRRPMGLPEWDILTEVAHSSSDKNYIDSVANGKQAYEYVVEAIDLSGNTSLSNVATLQGLSPMWPAVDSIDIADVNGTGPSINKKIGIAIGWNYGFYKELVGFKIYRSKDGNPYVQYAVYNLNEAQGMYDSVTSSVNVSGTYRFIDHKVQHTHRYRYKVVALFDDGTTSPMSEPSTLIFNL